MDEQVTKLIRNTVGAAKAFLDYLKQLEDDGGIVMISQERLSGTIFPELCAYVLSLCAQEGEIPEKAEQLIWLFFSQEDSAVAEKIKSGIRERALAFAEDAETLPGGYLILVRIDTAIRQDKGFTNRLKAKAAGELGIYYLTLFDALWRIMELQCPEYAEKEQWQRSRRRFEEKR